MGLYEQILSKVGEQVDLAPSRPPRVSGSVVLWRRRAGNLEVFWIKRAETLQFMGGFFAFPGGGMSRRDQEVSFCGEPSGLDGAPAEAAMPAAVTEGVEELGPILVDGLLACVLRELFEETGLLLGVDRTATGLADSELAEAQQRVLSKAEDFLAVVERLGVELNVSQLVYGGRWLTPPLGPLRFDNRFFLLEWPEDRQQQPVIIPGEAELGEWIEPRQGIDRWHAGEVVTAPPILHILQVLSEEGPVDGLARLHEPYEVNLGVFRRIEFRPGVLLFPVRTPTLPPAAFTNTYLLGTQETVLVDPGTPFPAEIERLRAALDDTESKLGRRVQAILLTHHHPDHIGGVETLRQALGVPVWAHAQTAERLRDLGIEIDRELVDGERLVLEGEPPFPVRVIYTPGHARGHIALLDESHGSLLAGDLVAGFGTIVIDPPEGNMEQYLQSLARVRELEPVALFPAHGPPTKAVDSKLKEYLEHRGWREDRILAAWQGGLHEPAEIVAAVYDDVPVMAHPLAERQILAHLEHLKATGRID